MAFHRLTIEDWQRPDPISEKCYLSALDGTAIEMDGEAWAREFLSDELDPSVPADIHDLFAVAQGTLVYGWFYYPLFEDGQQQLFRLAEAAAFHRYRAVGGIEARPTFNGTIEWLQSRGELSQESVALWQTIRALRNDGAHAKRRSVTPPGHVSRVLTNVALAVNSMFSADQDPGTLSRKQLA